MRILVLVNAGYFPPYLEELKRREQAGSVPRSWLLNLPPHMELHVLDDRFLGAPRIRRSIYRALPMWVAQGIEAFLIKKRYDVVLCWGAERIGLPFLALCRLTRSRVPFVALWSWISAPKKARLLRFGRFYIDRLVLPSSVQQACARRQGVPESAIVPLPWSVDPAYWSPRDVDTDMICGVGREMRDFGTLIKAVRDLDIPCHIAANHVPGTRPDAWARAIEECQPLPPHITIGTKDPEALRDLYARSRFLVMPLLPGDTDNGSTSILEAMAVGRPVICSRTEGQVDIVEDGRTGQLVPPCDIAALRSAIEQLWDDPAKADAMGRAAREHVERRHGVDGFIEAMAGAVQAAYDRAAVRRSATDAR